ncbi:hypothetical protein ACLESO_31440 [Pyxidicoccus sp. 3LG]
MMDLRDFSTENPPSREDMEGIGRELLASLSRHLKKELLTFKEHYVEEGSMALTFRSAELVHEPLALQLEGSLLFDVRSPGLLPSVDAEVLLFSFGKRVGLQAHRGNSYLQLSYDVEGRTWGQTTWLADAPEDWEGVSGTRNSEYVAVVKTFDWT